MKSSLQFAGYDLGIPQALILLDLHDDGGHSTIHPLRGELLVAASMVAELYHLGRLRLSGGKLSLKPGRPASRMLEPVEEAIGGRPEPIAQVLDRVREAGLRHAVHADLVGRGALRVSSRRTWWFFKSSTWPTADPALERALIQHLEAAHAATGDTFRPEDSVFALMELGGLECSVFSTDLDLTAYVHRDPIARALRETLVAVAPKLQRY